MRYKGVLTFNSTLLSNSTFFAPAHKLKHKLALGNKRENGNHTCYLGVVAAPLSGLANCQVSGVAH